MTPDLHPLCPWRGRSAFQAIAAKWRTGNVPALLKDCITWEGIAKTAILTFGKQALKIFSIGFTVIQIAETVDYWKQFQEHVPKPAERIQICQEGGEFVECVPGPFTGRWDYTWAETFTYNDGKIRQCLGAVTWDVEQQGSQLIDTKGNLARRSDCFAGSAPGDFHVMGTVAGSTVEWSWFSGDCTVNTGTLQGNQIIGTRNCDLPHGQHRNNYTVTISPGP